MSERREMFCIAPSSSESGEADEERPASHEGSDCDEFADE
jgi:hypothetical protein